jgi:Integrase zinc binding domain
VLAEYDIQLKHRSGANNRANALSRPPGTDEGSQDNQDITVLPNHLFCRALQLEDLEQRVQQAQKQHPFQLEEWKNKYEINVSDGMWVQNGRGVVPEDPELRREILRASHDHAMVGHPRIKGTLQLTARNYWWPKMGDFVLSYMKGCAQCQATKPSTNKPKVPLFPISVEKSSQPFSTIALDLIVDLPPSKGYDSILTITDHDVSKAALFFPCTQKIGVAGVAELFATQVFPHFGVPTKVISDRDTRFTSHFTRELCRLLGIAQNISTAYHPQTNGQSECTNQWLKQYLRIYCNF